MMNIYKKLQDARCALQSVKMKKSGNNKFAGYTYFELSDFLGPAQKIFNEAGLTGLVSFGKEEATLTIHEHDGEGVITFTCPRAEVSLKGCHPIQNEGAIQTYQRRYLWMTALEIDEHDATDATTGKDTVTEKKEKQPTTVRMQEIIAYCCELLDKNDPAFCNEWNVLTEDEKKMIWTYFSSKQKQASKTLIYNSNNSEKTNKETGKPESNDWVKLINDCANKEALDKLTKTMPEDVLSQFYEQVDSRYFDFVE